LAKHVPIPGISAQEIGVDTILSWTQDVIVTPDAPRKGRELQVCLHLHGAAVVVKVFKAIPRTSTGKASGSSPPG